MRTQIDRIYGRIPRGAHAARGRDRDQGGAFDSPNALPFSLSVHLNSIRSLLFLITWPPDSNLIENPVNLLLILSRTIRETGLETKNGNYAAQRTR
jgi:hypothetical protein